MREDELMQASHRTLDQSSSLAATAAGLPAACSRPTWERAAPSTFAPAAIPSLRRNFSWALGGNMVFAACQWGNLVVLAKLADQATVGQFALALAVTGPIFMLTNLQLRGVQATDAAGTYRFGHYLALRLACTMLAVAAIPIVMLCSSYPWSLAALFLAVGLGKAFDSMNDVACGLVQRHERLDRAAVGRIIAGAGSLLGLALLAKLTGNLIWASLGWAAGHGLATVLAPLWVGTCAAKEGQTASVGEAGGVLTWSAFTPIWDRKVLVRLTTLALPLGIAMMFVSLYFNIPRYFIEGQLGDQALGVFAALAYLMVAGHMVVVAVGQAVTPRFARQFAAGQVREFIRLLAILSLIAGLGSALGVVVAWLWGDLILATLYTSDYAGQEKLFVVLVGVSAVQYVASLFGDAMTAVRWFRPQVPLLVAVVAITALACYLLIPEYGLIGGALASGVGALCQLVGFAAILAYALRQRTREAP